MPLDYSDRKLWSVQVHGFSATEISDTAAASTSVTIYFSAQDNDALPGPKIDLEFAFPAAHDSTLQELQREALAGAAAILGRLSRETAETLEAAETKRIREAIVPDVG